MTSNGTIVRSQSGVLEGVDGDVRAFKGIPFAAPPVGPMRWRPPQPPQPWSGVRSAKEFGKSCPQPGGAPDAMSEDCLTLNVWTPRDAEGLPVMVWFHGGGWRRNSGASPRSNGAAMARRGVVVVTANFRLGILGFLAHPALSAESPEGVSSNYALRDQIAALEWVRDNIDAFGGDPANVTGFGQSSGAQAVCDLILSPRARGLLAKGIMQSAPIMRPGYTQMTLSQAEQDGRRYGDDIAALRAASPAQLMAMIPPLDPETRANIGNALYPVRDGVILPLDEKTAYETGQVARIPIIVGNNTDEGRHYAREVPVRTLDAYPRYLRARFGRNAEEAQGLYPAHDDESANYAQGVVTSDTSLSWGVRSMARSMSRLAPTYRYLYAHPRAGLAPTHGEEIPVLFGNELDGGGRPSAFTPDDAHVSARMMQAWVDFARTGNPNCETLHWPRYDADREQYLQIDRDFATGSGWRDAHIDFIARTLRR